MQARSTLPAVALGALVWLSACNSQEPLTLQEYAKTISAVGSENDACSQEVQREVNDAYNAEAGLPSEEDFAYFTDIVNGWQACLQDGNETLADVQPPAQLTEAHERLISARGDYLTEWRSFTAGLDSFDEFEAMFGAVEGTASAVALQASASAACQIGEILDDEGIEHEVPCQEAETESTEPQGEPEVVLVLADYNTDSSSGECSGALELSQVAAGSNLQVYDGTGDLIAEIELPTPHETEAGCVFELGNPLDVSLDEYAEFTLIPESGAGSGSGSAFDGNRLIITYTG